MSLLVEVHESARNRFTESQPDGLVKRMQGDRVSNIPAIVIGDRSSASPVPSNDELEPSADRSAGSLYAATIQRRSSEPTRSCVAVLTSSVSVSSEDPSASARERSAALAQFQSSSFDDCLEETQRSIQRMKAAKGSRRTAAAKKKLLRLQFVQKAEDQHLTMFSPDMEAKIYERIRKTLGHKYGGLEKATRAAVTVQKAYREYKLRKHFEEIRRDGVRPMSRRSSLVAKEKWLVGPMVKQQAFDLSDVDLLEAMGEDGVWGEGDSQGSLRVQGQQLLLDAHATTGSGDKCCDEEEPESGSSTLRRCKSLTSNMMAHISLVERDEEEEEEGGGGESDETTYWDRMVGIHLFNRKPSSGIQYLISKGIINDTPRSVAKFLREQDGLSKIRIGEFIGEIRYEFNMAVLEHLAHSINMKNKPIDEALREFQTLFLMPGEAQKIDKIMQIFAAEYIEANGIQVGNETHVLSALEYLAASQSEFETEDAVYVLAFSIMMLHTSLHNPSVKNRDSKEQWIKMNRGINGGGNFSKLFLLEIYDRILKKSFVTGQDHTRKVAEIQEKLVGSDILKQSSPHRSFVDEVTVFELEKVNSWKKGKHLRCLLMFNDLVVVTKKNKEHYIFKRSFFLLNATAVPYQSADLPEKYGIQVYSSMDHNLLFQCCCRTKSEYERLYKDLNDSIKLLNLLEKERITASQEQPHRHANKRVIKTGDLLPSGQPLTRAKSTNYLPGVGNLHSVIDPSVGLRPLSAANLSIGLENLHQLDDESENNRCWVRSMINISSDRSVDTENSSFDKEMKASFEKPEHLNQVDAHQNCRVDHRHSSMCAGKVEIQVYDYDVNKLNTHTYQPNTVSVV